ncbi:hypothetical protein OK016_14875 [Vibrio chagasii]|nr:hypothetical protein [Vibrio chagasii]
MFLILTRTRNPSFGGPMVEGRSFLQDIGLNLFVAVLAADRPQNIGVFQGIIVIKMALLECDCSTPYHLY